MKKLIALSLLALSPMLPIFAVAYGEEIKPMHPTRFGGFFVDKLEYRTKKEDLKFHISSFYGGDYHKLVVDVKGERGLKNSKWLFERADLLFVKAISGSLDLRAGVGYAGSKKGGRSRLVLGVKGLAPYGFEVDADLNLTNKGELYGKLGAEYELSLTQRLILQPSFEVLASTKKIEPLGVGSGLNKTKLALTLRYEIEKEFEPSMGVSWERRFGQTKERDIVKFQGGLKIKKKEFEPSMGVSWERRFGQTKERDIVKFQGGLKIKKKEFEPSMGISWERRFGQTKERDLINFLVGLKTRF